MKPRLTVSGGFSYENLQYFQSGYTTVTLFDIVTTALSNSVHR